MKKTGYLRMRRLLAVCAAGLVIACSSLTAHAATPLTSDNFDSKKYADQYSDVKAELGYDHAKLWNHYVKYGINENRTAYATGSLTVK